MSLQNWLVGGWATPLNNISQLGVLFPIYGKIKHVPNHQPADHGGSANRTLGFNSLQSTHIILSPRADVPRKFVHLKSGKFATEQSQVEFGGAVASAAFHRCQCRGSHLRLVLIKMRKLQTVILQSLMGNFWPAPIFRQTGHHEVESHFVIRRCHSGCTRQCW